MSPSSLPNTTITGALGAMHLLAERDGEDTLLRLCQVDCTAG